MNWSQIRNILLWLLMLAFSVVIMWVAFQFHGHLKQFRSFGILGIFLINFFGSATVFVPAPAIATVIAGSAVYPPLAVGLSATLGAVIGDMTSFILGYSSKHVLIRKDIHWYEVVENIFKRFGGLAIFLFALIPNPLFDAIGIVAGVLDYPWKKFFLYLFLGRLARNMILAFFGARLDVF